MRNLFIFFVIFVFITCGKDSPTGSIGKDNFVLSTIDLIFLSEGEEKTFKITCDSDWTISCAAPWCKVVPVSGTGDAEITVITDSYEDYYDRNTKLSVAMGDSVQFVTVTQKKKNTILLAKDKYTVPSTGEIITVEVRSNVDYNVAIPSECKEWIKEIQQARTMEPKSLKFKIAANETAGKRNGIIVFEDKATTFADTVYVFQEQEYLIFSDDVFQQYLLDNFDKNHDGHLSVSEAREITSIGIQGDNLNLDGLDYFPELRYLSCMPLNTNSQLGIKKLDVSKNKYLIQLFCSSNQLTELDLSANVSLEELWCSNNQLTSLDLNSCPYLKILLCINNPLQNLEITNCSQLAQLLFPKQLESLKISNNEALIGFDYISEFLEYQLKYLELKNCSQLKSVMWYFGHKLESMSIASCPLLEKISCSSNQVTSLTIDDCPALQELHCGDNQLSTLNVSGYTFLTKLDCFMNQLTTLDVGGCTSLTELDCFMNQLTTLDVSGCTSLTELWCSNNQLTTLDVSSCTSLTKLSCYGNPNLKTIYKKKGQYIDISAPNNVEIIEL